MLAKKMRLLIGVTKEVKLMSRIDSRVIYDCDKEKAVLTHLPECHFVLRKMEDTIQSFVTPRL